LPPADDSSDSTDQQFGSQALPESMVMKAMKMKKMMGFAPAKFHRE
jgi:hypothetical protein